SWAKWTAANLDNLEALAELPLLEATMERILELDESYSYGSPHLLRGTYLAAKPAILGGDMAKAKEHLDRALALADGKFLPAKVLYAKYYVRRIQDRELFVRTLEEVLSAPSDTVPELTLSNAVAKEQAKELLEKTDEYFGGQPQSLRIDSLEGPPFFDSGSRYGSPLPPDHGCYRRRSDTDS
ncbi:MAG TPA: TRAP transporter TatT component family protein, partial [Syntrophobacteria bacterium]|nr:TRAP transporter TatT component family protein [Syntrophobacteria bacterium]